MNTESSMIGHNSERFDDTAAKKIRDILDRVSRLTDDKEAISQDIKEVYAEAKGIGLDPKILRKLAKLERMDAEKRREEEELLDLYKTALGMV